MKFAVVIPWFGRDIRGGAEQHAWQIASRLAQRGHSLQVLTTCCRSHQDDWATNHLPAGAVDEPEGFTVRRFPVDPRDRASFDRVAGHLMNLKPSALQRGVSPVSPADSEVFCEELIKSGALLHYLETNKRGYDWFILLPYLYGPVLSGVGITGERAALLPCLHDEAYAYLPQVAEIFRQAGKLLFNSDGEQELALRLFGPGIWNKSIVIGGGVEVELPGNDVGCNGSDSTGHGARYVLYLGRKDAGKNVPMLLRAFQRFRAVRPNSDLRLLLAGNGEVNFRGDGKAAQDLGLVGDEAKKGLLKNCAALFQPSQNESLSRVMMEAWMNGRPVAAHASCLATAVAVERSGGGWLAESEEDWAGLFVKVARATESELSSLGERGKAYAEELADWEQVLERLEQALAPARPVLDKPSRRPAHFPRRQINQFLPNLAYGDAISNHAIWIRETLRDLGFQSEIFARYIDPRVAHECQVFSSDVLKASTAVIYHHSIGSEITSHLLGFAGPKCLIYHNITPAEFFAPYWPEFAAIAQRGREDLSALARHFPISLGVSKYNASELEKMGFEEPGVMPIAVDPARWNFAPDEEVLAGMQDGRTNVLFVGRIAPNKKQNDLLQAFAHFRQLEPDARLVLIGKAEEADPYAKHVSEVICSLGLGDSVIMPGSVSDAQLAACYRTAHLFWSMSEHEGFCVPLVEAMWFDLPILAFGSSGIPETLGPAGLMFTSKEDLSMLAGLASLMIRDTGLRQKVIRAQRSKRAKYLPAEIESDLRELAGKLLGRELNAENQWN